MKYFPPKFNLTAFHCPFCQVFANMSWQVKAQRKISRDGHILDAQCSHCLEHSVWIITQTAWGGSYGSQILYEESIAHMIYPSTSSAPMPHEDLPEELRENYLEARDIIDRSPRGAAVLLGLLLEEWLISEIPEGKNMNGRIKRLAERDLPEHLKQALDYVRITRAGATHAGDLKEFNTQIKENSVRVMAMFELINMITEEMITKKRKVANFYALLPEKDRENAAKRDKKN